MLTDEEIKNEVKSVVMAGLNNPASQKTLTSLLKWARDKACEWIPVDKENPNEEESVLILTKEGSMSVARFSNKLPWWKKKVTHWQRLPQKLKIENS